MNLKDLFASITGTKIDFGGGDVPIEPSFTIFDMVKPSQDLQYPRIYGNVADRHDVELVKLKGEVAAATCRHLFSCIPREQALQAFMNIHFTMKPGAPFLFVDFDFDRLTSIATDPTFPHNIPVVLGQTFWDWAQSIRSSYALPGDPFLPDDFLNIAMRGFRWKEIKFRYGRDTIQRLLFQAGFRDIREIGLNGGLGVLGFTHTRVNESGTSGEDMVFFCRK